jgi:hypothetical protein
VNKKFYGVSPNVYVAYGSQNFKKLFSNAVFSELKFVKKLTRSELGESKLYALIGYKEN